MDGKLPRRGGRGWRVLTKKTTVARELARARKRIAVGDPLLALLDLDGTLADFVVDPKDVRMHPGVREALRKLLRLPGARVVIVTGRDARKARAIVGVDGVEVSGLHGREFVDRAGKRRRIPVPAKARARLETLLKEARALAAALPGSRVEDKRPGGVAFHTRGAPDEAAALRAERAFTRSVRAARVAGIEPMAGKRVIEARVAGVSKGTAVRALVTEENRKGRAPVVLFAGDDLTDEDAHRALARTDAFTILVSRHPRPTAARTRVREIAQVRDLLVALAHPPGINN